MHRHQKPPTAGGVMKPAGKGKGQGSIATGGRPAIRRPPALPGVARSMFEAPLESSCRRRPPE